MLLAVWLSLGSIASAAKCKDPVYDGSTKMEKDSIRCSPACIGAKVHIADFCFGLQVASTATSMLPFTATYSTASGSAQPGPKLTIDTSTVVVFPAVGSGSTGVTIPTSRSDAGIQTRSGDATGVYMGPRLPKR